MGRIPKEFALYKDEEFLCIGTIKEIAKEMNLNESTVRFYATEAYKIKTGGNGKVLVCLDDDDNEV